MPHPLVVHCKRSPYDVYVGRPSVWGNPFPLRMEAERAVVLQRYREWLMGQPHLLERIREELRGKRLGCWCAPRPCHADLLAEIANAE
jgi:hypothetical protein